MRRPRPPPSRRVTEGRRGRLAACGGLAIGAVLAVQGADATGWDVIPRLSVQAVLSDNLDLDPPGEEDAGFVWVLNPGLSIHNREQGGRVQLAFDYSPQGLRYGSDTDQRSNGWGHRGQALAKVEAVEDHLFFDLRMGANLTNTDRTSPQVADQVAGQSLLTQSFYYGISPYYLHHFGNVADATLRYRFDEVLYEGDSPDSTSNGVNLLVVSGSDFPRLGWDVAYDYRKVEYDDSGQAGGSSRDTKFEEIVGRIRYPLNSQWAPFASLGYEDNDYQSSFGQPSGRTWSLGVNYTPSQRTSLSAGYRDRAIGDNWFFNFRHRGHRTAWTARYDEDLTTSRDILIDQQLVPLFDEFGNPIQDPLSGANLFVPIDIPSPNTDVILSKRLDGSVSYLARRTTTTLRVYHNDREYQESGDTDKVLGSSLQIGRRLDRRTSGTILATWQRTEYEPESDTQTYWNFGLRLNRDLAQDVRGTLEVRHQENDGDRSVDNYRENRITAGVTYTF